MKTNITKIALGVGLALGLAAEAQAAGVLFNSGKLNNGPDNFKEVTSFDWQPGNFLAKGTGILSVGETFTGYYQAELTKITYSDGSFDNIPIGSNGPFEITATAVFNEQVVGVGDVNNDGVFETAQFRHLGGTFNIYFDNLSGTTNADGVVGNSGLGYGDGTQIFASNILDSIGAGASYTNLIDLGTIGLDQNAGGGDQDGGTDTFQGLGTANVSLLSTFAHSNWWIPASGSGAGFITSLLLTTLNNPFATINPEVSVGGQTPTHLGGRAGDTFNGLTTAEALGCLQNPNGAACNDDFQFLADASQNFQRLPEPEQLSLLGIGLAAMGFVGRRRRTA